VATLNSATDVAKEAHLANINALLIFTAEDGLNTGLFHFTKVNVDMEIYNLPFRYHFASESDFNYFLSGNIGYSRVFTSREFISSPGSLLTAESHLQTYTAGLGVGVRYKLREDLSFLGGLELIYSRSGVNVKQADENIVDPIEDFFDNNYNDNLSYKLFLESEYQPSVKYMKPYFKIQYKFYDTKSDFSYEKLAAFSTQSSVLSGAMGTQSESLFSNEYGYTTLEAYLTGNYLQGDVVKSIGFDNYVKVGAVAYWYTPDEPSWVRRFFLEVSTIHAVGLEGYNIGVGFSLDY